MRVHKGGTTGNWAANGVQINWLEPNRARARAGEGNPAEPRVAIRAKYNPYKATVVA